VKTLKAGVAAASVVITAIVAAQTGTEPRRIATAPAFNARADGEPDERAVEKDVLNPGAIAVCSSSKHWVIFTVWG